MNDKKNNTKKTPARSLFLMVPQLGIEPRTQGFSVRVFVKSTKRLKNIFLIIT